MRNFKMRSMLGLLLAVGLFVGITIPAFAATTQDVTVTATPTFISIANAPATYDFGAVAASSTPATAQAYFTITNGSSVPIDITIGAQTANWTGGVGWVHDDTGAGAAADTAGLMSSNNTGAYNIAVHNVTPQELTADVPVSTNPQWELKLYSPSSFADGAEKTMVVRLTAAASP